MVKKFLVFTVAVLAIAIGVVACGENKSTTTEKEFTASQVKEYSKGAKAAHLSGTHLKEDLACADCHGETAGTDDSEQALNAACVSCHGDLDAMAAKNEREINPHKSHLGEVNCTSCHAGHTTSYVYCNYCHSFEDLKIPNAGARPAVSNYNPAKWEKPGKPTKTITTDIVVIGSGGAGLSSAIVAHDAGAKVIVFEKMPIPGGNSQLSAGGMNAALTRYQKAKNIPDSPEVMYEDTMKGGKDKSNPELAKILAFESNATMEWLIAHNITLSNPGFGGGATYARFHAPGDGSASGSYLVKHLKALAKERNMDVRVNARVVKLITAKDGAVTGVLVSGKHEGLYQVNAKSVILASGGFSANAEMVTKYQPSYKGMTTSNQPGALGDGMLLGQAVGGELIDMDFIQIHPTVAVGSQILITEAVRGRGAIIVSHNGVRIMDELTTRDKASATILKEAKPTAYLIFDETTRSKLKQIDGYFHLELVKQGKDADELASVLQMPAGSLAATVERYNSLVKAGKDEDFGRKDLPQEFHGRLYAIEIAPGIHYTMGGLKIGTDASVLRSDNSPITNLYAAGEVTGGVHGANRLGGNSISEMFTFGRIAGASAVANVK